MNRGPSYEAFKRLSSFSPEIGDFCIKEAEFKKLIASECHMDVNGLGMGDMTLLFLSVARKGFITYEGVLQLHTILVKRVGLLEKRVEEERSANAAIRKRIQDLEEELRPVAPTFSRMFERPKQSERLPQAVSSESLNTKSAVSTSLSFNKLSGLLQKGRNSGSYLTGDAAQASGGILQGIYHQREPPLLLRETLVVPDVSAPAHIKAKVQGLKQMREANPSFVVNGLILDCWREWEQDVGGKGVPLAGIIYFYLVCGACLLDIGDIATAKTVLASAQHQYDSKLLGIDHPLNDLLFLTLGIAYYMGGEFEEALREFESALGLAELVSKQGTNPFSSMNASTAINNIGCCHTMMGQRSEAVAAFRKAVSSLQGSPSGFNNGASTAALTNLNRAIKLSFAFPPASSLSRPLTAPVSSTLASSSALRPTGSNEKLKAFLRSAVTITQPSIINTVPVWATRSNGEEAAKKAAAKAKGGKDGKKDGKKEGKKEGKGKKKGSKTFAPSYPGIGYDMPSFSVANVILPKKPKAKKKKEEPK